MATPSTFKSRLRKVLARAPLRHLASPVFDAAVATELAVLERWRAPPSVAAAAPTSVTAIIKTFERPRLLRRLVRSLLSHFPGLPIIVADDSRRPTRLAGVRTLALPFDVGVSVGRQAALDEVETELTWVLDDDFVIYGGSRLNEVLAALRAFPQLDLVGGPVFDLPLGTRRGSIHDPLYPTAAAPRLPLGLKLGPVVVCDKVPNFFVARTAQLRGVGWDARLKRVEHGDFFTRARGVLATGYMARFSCLHAQAPFDVEYMRRRDEYAADEELLRARHFSGS